MDHISGNKSPMGSIEVPFDREYPEIIEIYREYRMGGATRPQKLIARPHHGSVHPHKISDRYDSPSSFKKE
jgi:hypothetical protein